MTRPFVVSGLLAITLLTGSSADALPSVASAKQKVTKAAKGASDKLSNATGKLSKSLVINKEEKDRERWKLRDKWGVVVGIEKYLDPSIKRFRCGEKSALVVSTALAEPDVGRFGPAHVVVVSNAKASFGNVTKVLGEPWLLKHALPKDLVFIYIATRYKVSDDGSDLLLYMYDTALGQEKESALKLKDTLKELKSRSQSDQIVVLLDILPISKNTSDTTSDSVDELDEPEPSAAPANASANLLSSIARETGTTIFASSQIGTPTNHASVSGCTVFSASLVEGLRAGNGNSTFEAVSEYVSQQVKEEVLAQSGKEQQTVLVYPDLKAMAPTVIGSLVKSSVPVQVGHAPAQQGDHPLTPSRVRALTQSSGVAAKAKRDEEAAAKRDEETKRAGESAADMGTINKDLDFGPYMSKMKQSIQAKWVPPKGFDAKRVVAVFSISKNGEISNAEIVEGSGAASVDESAMAALKAASPLEPLPDGAPPYVQIRYQFDWKVNKN